MKKRIFSRVLALVMAVSLLSTTAFAASFADLQNAIDGKGGQSMDNGHTGYAWNEGLSHWGIEAWDQDGTRNVQLNENVVYNSEKDKGQGSINLDNSLGSQGSVETVVLDLQNNAIDGNKENSFMHGGNRNVAMLKECPNLTIKNGTITNSTGSGIVVNGDVSSSLTLDHVNLTNNNGRGISIAGKYAKNFSMTGGTIEGNASTGLYMQQNVSYTVDGVLIQNNGGLGVELLTTPATGTISNTQILNNTGRGIFLGSGRKAELDHVKIQGNAGGIYAAGISASSTITVRDCIITENEALAPENLDPTNSRDIAFGGGIHLNGSNITLNLEGKNEIYNNTDHTGNSDIYASAGATISGIHTSPAAPDGKQFDGWYGENGKGGKYEGPEKIEETVNLVGNLSDAPEVPDNNTDDTTPDDTTVVPDPADTPADADTGTTIEDEETPLAGIVTLADLLNALWEYEGIEEVELPEDFQWLDHDYAQAIYWGLDEALVVDTEDDPLDPDELLTVGLMREVLVNFVELYHGLEDFEVVLEGADEDLVMDLGERLTVFYGELEAALEAQAA